MRARSFILLAVALGLLIWLARVWSLPKPGVSTLAEPIYGGSGTKREIALTFNVFWGEEYIPEILAILKKNDVQATFFLGGTWVQKFPDLAREIAGAGQEIASHGYSHPHVDNLSVSANLEEIQKAAEIIYKYTGKKPALFAPPYGERGPSVLEAARQAGCRVILWSADTIDWQRPDPWVIVRRVMKGARPGAIVLMHPTAPTVHALPDIIANLKNEGYRLVSVGTLIENVPDNTVKH